MDIHVLRNVRFQQVDYKDGLYTAALGNALSDFVANGLIGLGAAIQLNLVPKVGIVNDITTELQKLNPVIEGVSGVGNGKIYGEDGNQIVAVGVLENDVQLVATRGECNLLRAQANGANKVRITGRARAKTGAEYATHIALSLQNFYVHTDRTELNTGNAVAVRCHIEIPGAPNPVVIASFNSSQTGTMPDGSTDFPTDLIPASSFGLTYINPETECFYVVEYTVNLNEYYPVSVAPQDAGESAYYSNASVSAIGVAGDLPNLGGGAVTTAMPMAAGVIGKFIKPHRAAILFCDSLGFGFKDGIVNGNIGGAGGAVYGGMYARGCYNSGTPYARQARSGTTAQQAAANYVKQSGIWKYANVFICNLGTNDGGGSTAAATLAWLNTIWAAAKAAGIPNIWQSLILNRCSASTDSWATVANQTVRAGYETGGTFKDPLNAAIVAAVGNGVLTGFVDMNIAIKDIVSQDKIIAPGGTDDGVHFLPYICQKASAELSRKLLAIKV